VPQRSLYRYLDLSYLEETQIMLSPQKSGLELAQSMAVFKNQLKQLSRKMEEKIIDNEALPAKNRVEAAELKARLDLASVKITQHAHIALVSRGGTAQLISEVEAILKDRSGSLDSSSSDSNSVVVASSNNNGAV
jgi:hypothetical protein